MNLIVENVIQNKNEIIISVNISVPVSIKNQQNIACAKKIMLGALAYLLANVTQIVTLVNIQNGDAHGDDLVVTCDKIAYTCQRLHRSMLITKRTIGVLMLIF